MTTSEVRLTRSDQTSKAVAAESGPVVSALQGIMSAVKNGCSIASQSSDSFGTSAPLSSGLAGRCADSGSLSNDLDGHRHANRGRLVTASPGFQALGPRAWR